MKAKEVLKLTGLSRSHLSRLVKSGVFSVSKKPNGQYDYKVDDVYEYLVRLATMPIKNHLCASFDQ